MRKSTIFGLTASLALTAGLIYAGQSVVSVPAVQADETATVQYTLDPANGASVEDLSSITITFEAGVNVGFYENLRPAAATLENLDNGDVYYCVAPFFNGRNDKGETVYTLEFAELGASEIDPITKTGNYELTIRGLYTSTIDEDGEESEPVDLPIITAEYTIEYPVEYTLSPAAGSKVENLSKVEITFPAGLNVGFYDNMRPAAAIIENLDNGDVYYCEAPFFEGRNDVGETTWSFEFAELGSTETVAITAVGNYQLTIMGLFTTTIDDEGEESEPEDLPVITANYEIVFPVDYTLDPESGATISEISTVTLTFEAGVNVGFYDNIRPGAAVIENLDNGDVYYCEAPFFVGRNEDGCMSYTLEFAELGSSTSVTINQQGTYQLTVMGLYTTTIDDEGEESERNDLPVITAKYTIPYPVAYTIDPEDGTNLNSISKITVTFENPNVGFYDGVRPGVATLENTTNGDVYFCYAPMKSRDEEGNSVLELEFCELGSEESVDITSLGNYQLTIRGLYYNSIDEDGEETDPIDLPIITANYSIVYPIEYYLNPEDGEVVNEISSVTITFQAGMNVGFAEVRPAVAILENNDPASGEIYYCESPFFAGRDENGAMSYTFEFCELGSTETSTIKTDGVYKLSILGVYTTTIDEEGEETEPEYLPTITSTIIVDSSFDGVAIERPENNSVVNAFNLNGIQVIRNGNANDVKALNPGLYIINGKKVIIRK